MLFTAEKPLIVEKPEDKFRTVLFLPPNPERKGEGGLRTKGYFRHNYKKIDGTWFTCDIQGSPVQKASSKIVDEIEKYLLKSVVVHSDPSRDSIFAIEFPLITVITVVLNNAKGLEKTLRSVISQDYPNVEYIVIDGGSTDETLDVIKIYTERIDYWISEKDNGISDAFNKGVKLSTGSYLNFLNAGDVFISERALSNAVRYLTGEYRVVSFFAKFGYRTIPKKRVKNNSPLHKKAMISHQASFIQRNVFKEWGVYDDTLKLRMDYEFWARILRGEKLLFVPETIVDYDVHGISGKNLEQFYEEEMIVNKKYLNLWEYLFRMGVIFIRTLQMRLKKYSANYTFYVV